MERIKAADLYEYRFLSEVTVSPDGAHTAFVARNSRADGQGYDAYIWLLDNESGALRRMTGSASDSSLSWLDGNRLIFISARGGAKAGRTEFYTLDIRGGEAALAFTVPLAVKLYRPLADGRWFVLTRRPMESAEGLDSNRAQPGRDYTVYDELPFWADGIGVVSGTRMSGWVFNPADGSVEQVTGRNFDAEGAAVSPDGRSVLYWGVEFENIRPDLDAERLGVCGGSYGGFMTNWIIGHTGRFKAACAMRSISNFVSSISTCDKGYLFLLEHMGVKPWEHGGNMWEDSEILWEKSPLKYVRNVTTPTLFIHSNTDFRCYMDEALQMFVSLKQMGVPSKVVLIHNEGHELNRGGRPANRIIRLNALCEWFDKYLGGGPEA